VSQPYDSVIPPRQSSIGLVTYELAKRIARSCDVVVYLKKDASGKSAELREGVKFKFFRIKADELFQTLIRKVFGNKGLSKDPRKPLFASRLYFWWYILRVAMDVKREKCDIVHVHNYPQFASLVKTVNPGAKVVLHMNCEWLNQLDPAATAARLEKVDLILGCSRFIAGRIKEAFPEVSGRCHALHNGVDPDMFSGGTRSGTESGKSILFIARISPEKGVHVLVEAFREVLKKHPDARLVLVGYRKAVPRELLVDFSDDPRVRDLARFYEKDYFSQVKDMIPPEDEDKVVFTGQIGHDDTVRYYREANVFVFPSVWNEPFGIPVVEAMASGTPVVATRSGGIEEIIEDGRSGLLAERGSAGELARGMMRLLEDGALREQVVQNGRKRVKDVFSFDRIAEDLLARYESII